MKHPTYLLLTAIILSAKPAFAEVEFHKDVMPLIEANCVTCHARKGVSFSFEDPDETYNFRAAIALSVENGRMPPWLAEPGHQEYVGDYSLTTDERELIADWAAAGFPRSESVSVAAANNEIMSFDADLTIAVLPDGTYLPPQDRTDEYRCFIVDWPYETDKYVTGFMAEPGNTRVAHHLVNHAIGPDAVEIIKALSDEEEGPGHRCFGGPLPDRIGDDGMKEKIEARFPGGWETLLEDNYWLSHWAPGTYGVEFPEDTGILMVPGSAIVVQMHYYTAFAPGESDSNTVMHFQVADTVRKPSINYPLTNNRWLFGARNHTMQISPGSSATFETSVGFDHIADYAAEVLMVDPEEVSRVELQSANVHMHAFGASGIASLLDSDGRKQTLLSIPNWDLAWQRDFMFTENKVIPRSEFGRSRLIVECTFRNDTEKTVYGGYGSDDEMCFNFSYISLVRRSDESLDSGDK